MKKKLLFLVFLFLLNASLYAQTFITSVEAETGVLTGVSIAAQTGNSSGPYVTGFDTDGDQVKVTLSVPTSKNYKLEIRYRSTFGPKAQDVLANDVFVGNINFPLTANFEDLNAGTVFLNAGANTITVRKSWGYMDVDKFSIYTLPENVFNITPNLIDNSASAAAKKVYQYLLNQFGTKIISGSTSDEYDNVKARVGKSPLLQAWDFASYSPMYPWKWGGAGHVFGPVDNQDAEKAINWYNASGKKGIVAIHWHWGSPSGGTAGTNTFYTQFTNFDVSKAVINGTQENTEVIRDIDAIAVQLKKLQAADVPVLWRPLHEAGGKWFWWGAKGSGPAKALWDIMYERLNSFHGLHNLIWVWSSPEADWYPGNEKVDMIGYDSYPGEFNYTTQKNVFDNLFTITGGKKLIAMTENGPIPDIDQALEAGAPWSYFMTWSNLVYSSNSAEHLAAVYANAKVLTVENYVAVLPVTFSGFTAGVENTRVKITWTTSSEQNNDYFEIKRAGEERIFSSLAKVKGQVHSPGAENYAVMDENPAEGLNYYQLLQYDKDGRSLDLGVRKVLFNGPANVSINTFPNPSFGKVGLELKNYKGDNVLVSIKDVSGKTIYSKRIETVPGREYYPLEIKQSSNGSLFIMQIEGGGLRKSLKLILK